VANEDLFAQHRAAVERFLELAAALEPGMQDRIRHAVRLRHYDAKAREQIVDTDAWEVGEHFLGQLKAADNELGPAEVRELEALIDAGLAEWPQPPELPSRGTS
jgi:hypothetical protein